MEATSPEQYAAYERREPAELEQVRDDVWALGLPMGAPIPPFTSLLHILRDSEGGLHLIDVGMANDPTWDRVVAAIESVGSSLAEVRSIIATHHHNEHIDLADRMREATGAPLFLSRAEQRDIDTRRADSSAEVNAQIEAWGVPVETDLGAVLAQRAMYLGRPLPTADVLLDDGDELPIPGFHLRAIASPGHSPGSMSFHDADREILFTGDHVLPNQVPGFGNGVGALESNPLADYLESLRRLPTDVEALPSHGWRFRGLADRTREIAERHLSRTREVAAILAEDADLSVWELASRLNWRGGWESLDGWTRFNALQQTDFHRDYVLTGGSLEY